MPEEKLAELESQIALKKLLVFMVEHQASDLHITANSAPIFRVNGGMVRAKTNPLTPEDTECLCVSYLSPIQQQEFAQKRQFDFSFAISNIGRFRGNLYFQRNSIAGAFRHIPSKIPKIDTLGIPSAIIPILNRHRGLILVCGATGSGKTTTLASMIDYLNDRESLHIITVEDPIEYVHFHRKSTINQREIGQDTLDFAIALRSMLRADPDVVLVGEMRDLETMETTLNLAETGHLVFSTLHANSAPQSIERLVQAFPSQSRDQVRLQLSVLLEAILTQVLLPRADGKGRVVACELLLLNASVRNLIRENKLYQIPTAMISGQEQTGMVTLNQSLFQLVKKNIVAMDVALETSSDPDELKRMCAEINRRVA